LGHPASVNTLLAATLTRGHKPGRAASHAEKNPQGDKAEGIGGFTTAIQVNVHGVYLRWIDDRKQQSNSHASPDKRQPQLRASDKGQRNCIGDCRRSPGC